MGKFEIKKNVKGEFYFNLKASNGLVILSSEGYSSKTGCENGIQSVRNHASDEANYERKISANSNHFFNLKASNGKVIGMSELYESKAALDIGIASVRTNAPDALVVDLT